MFSSRSADLVRMLGKLGCALSLGASMLSTSLQAQAQVPAGNPIRLLVGFPAGAGTDAIARTLAKNSRTNWGCRWWWRTAPEPVDKSRHRP